MSVAIIPARGGSKRIAHKNIRPFAGRPIIAYSIDAALRSGVFDRIIVSTDDDSIARVGRDNGAEVPFVRPAALADDHTGTGAVIRHALMWLRDAGYDAQFACCIYATAPFLRPESLREGLRLLRESDSPFAFAVTSFAYPIQRALRIRADGRVEALWPENNLVRSQDLEPAFHDAGQFYWGRASAFIDDLPVFASASLPIVLPRERVQDIDTLEDWERAEAMYRALEAT